MITDSLEFPCVEAARCHLTEKEYGLRLTITKKPAPLSKNKEHDQQASSCSFQLELTERRDRNTEWYVHFDVSTTKGGLALRSVSFRHVGTGRYLCFSSQDDDARRIGTQSFSNEDTIWLMEHPQSSSSPQSPQNHYSSPQHHRSPHSRSPPSPEPRRTYSDGLDLRRSNSIGWESSSGSPPRGVVESEPWTVQYHLLPKGLDSHKVSCHRSGDCKSGLELTTTEFDPPLGNWSLRRVSCASSETPHSTARFDAMLLANWLSVPIFRDGKSFGSSRWVMVMWRFLPGRIVRSISAVIPTAASTPPRIDLVTGRSGVLRRHRRTDSTLSVSLIQTDTFV